MGTHYQGTAAATLALDAYIKLVRATETLSARIHRPLAQADLTVSQFGVLEALWHLGPLCQRDLGAKLLKSGGNITLVVDNLEKRGLVQRERGTTDRRFISVHLTATGSSLIQQLFPAHVERVVANLSPLSSTEQEQLAQLCKKLGLDSAN
ncbi:MarR family winged helix-turn-helix transcriptional regulator [Candidatus Cyanaurora vandensis]|uniref:MarR family winged helix-turn-helix transcriptional regulator n=1 Tax=Candidatus Cyanaurora vandensis TaxID=2714958 RepID=UPI00257A6A09|nr:MarR family transcriptional regulator [Candidatus Cyanaurora vandensis]